MPTATYLSSLKGGPWTVGETREQICSRLNLENATDTDLMSVRALPNPDGTPPKRSKPAYTQLIARSTVGVQETLSSAGSHFLMLHPPENSPLESIRHTLQIRSWRKGMQKAMLFCHGFATAEDAKILSYMFECEYCEALFITLYDKEYAHGWSKIESFSRSGIEALYNNNIAQTVQTH